MSSREETVALIQRHLDNFAGRDPAALTADYTQDAVVLSPMFPGVKGREAVHVSYVALFDVFPDWEMTCEDPVVDGARATLCCTIRATQVGPFMGMTGTGRRFEFVCVLAFEVRDGLIARERRIYDFTGMLIQLGVIRGKPAV
jgi:predicted ester cyclase